MIPASVSATLRDGVDQGRRLLDGHCCLWSRPAPWPKAMSTPEVKNQGTNGKGVTAKGRGRMVMQEGTQYYVCPAPRDHLRGLGQRDGVISQLHHSRRLKAGNQDHAYLWSLTRWKEAGDPVDMWSHKATRWVSH